MNILELQKQRNDLIVEARGIFDVASKDNRDLSVDEKTKFDGLMDRSEALAAQIERLAKLEGAEVDLRTIPTAPIKPDPGVNGNGFRCLGENLQAVIRAASPEGRIDPRLRAYHDPEERASGMSEGISSEGGFLVQTDYNDDLLKETYEEATLAPRCREYPISAKSNGIKLPYIKESSRVDGSRWGGVIAYWKGEAIAKEAAFPDIGINELNLKKLTGYCPLTDELLEDTVALGAYVTDVFSGEFSFKIDKAIYTGPGGGQPLGVLNSPCLVTVAKETGQAADTIVSENIINMWSRCRSKYRFNAVWFINQDIEPQLFTMGIVIGTGGSPIYMPPGGLSAAPYGTLFGRPVIPIEQASTLGEKGDIMLADLKQYLIIKKGGMQAASSIHVRFLYDETVLRFVYRTDGQPKQSVALTPHSGSANTLSPFVTLAERA